MDSRYPLWLAFGLILSGHNNINRFCNRGFDNLHDMNSYMIDIINKTVKQNDKFYVIGDFSYRGGKPIEYLKHINCQSIFYIKGNHSKRNQWEELARTYDKIKYFGDVLEITHNKQSIFMSHYAHRVWPKSHHGSWMIYGHSHAKLDPEDRISKRKTLDVGVDNCVNYGKMFGEPWSFDEIKAIMETRTGEIDV